MQRDGVLYEHFTYDANGNRLAREADDETTTAEYDAQDRLRRYGAWQYTYNANGQLKTKTNTQTGALTQYTYDVRGNLLKVVLPNNDVIEYVVDGLDRRVGKKKNGALVKRWLYRDGLSPVAELDGSGALLSRFVYASRANVPDLIVRGGVTYRVFADHLGSPRVIVSTDANASVVHVMEHDAFGVVLSDTSPGWQPFGFAGGLWDAETGLVRFGARDYDAVTGRWTAKDPILFDGGDSNLYGYVGNDPINAVDPTGLSKFDKLFGLPKQFWNWYHRQVKRAGDADLTKDEALDLWKEWENSGKPGPDSKGKNKGDWLDMFLPLPDFFDPCLTNSPLCLCPTA